MATLYKLSIERPVLATVMSVVIVIFGASRLPQIGDGLGKGIKNFRGAMKEPPEIDVTPSKDSEEEESSP